MQPFNHVTYISLKRVQCLRSQSHYNTSVLSLHGLLKTDADHMLNRRATANAPGAARLAHDGTDRLTDRWTDTRQRHYAYCNRCGQRNNG